MLLDFIYERYNEEQIAGIRKAIAHLMRHQFYHPWGQLNTPVRNALSNGFTRKYIREFFELAGYKFVENETRGYFGIIPGDDIGESRSMSEQDSFILLVLKHTFDIGVDNGDMEDSCVQASFNEFCDCVKQFTGQHSWELKRSDIRSSLKQLATAGVLQIDSKVSDDDDLEMLIRPFIEDIVTFDVMTRIENFVRRKNGIADPALIDVTDPDERNEENNGQETSQ